MAHLVAGTSASALRLGSSARALARQAPASSGASRALSLSSARLQASPSSSTASLSTSLLLSRPPTILREPTAFESAYFLYNAKVSRALAQPFAKDFYFQKGSAAEQRFEEEEKARKALLRPQEAASAEKGTELHPEPETTTAAPATPATSEHEADLYATAPRRTAADEANDTKSLERALDKTLFLLFKDEQGRWRFPTTKLEGETPLHRVAPTAVHKHLGDDMDIWLVSNLPIAVLPSQGANGAEKTYFLRAHILAGQARADASVEYAWLTRSEVEERLAGDKAYLEGTRELLSE